MARKVAAWCLDVLCTWWHLFYELHRGSERESRVRGVAWVPYASLDKWLFKKPPDPKCHKCVFFLV